MTRRRRILRALVGALLAAGLAAPAAAAEPIHTGKAGVELIKEFEGFFPAVYLDPVGVRTQCYGATGVELFALPPIATREQCGRQLVRSLAARYEPAVRALKLGSQNRFDAATSIAFNVGTGVLSRGRSLGDALRARDWPRSAAAFRLYVFAGNRVFAGLVRRREAERRLFLRPDPVAFTKQERRLLAARLTPSTRAALKTQAHRIQLAARAVRGGWQLRDRYRRFPVLRARALTDRRTA